MKCEEFEELVPDYLDCLLSVEETRLIEAHAASCPDCAEALAQGRSLDGMLSAALRPPSLAEGFRERLRMRLDQPTVGPRQARWLERLEGIGYAGLGAALGSAIPAVWRLLASSPAGGSPLEWAFTGASVMVMWWLFLSLDADRPVTLR